MDDLSEGTKLVGLRPIKLIRVVLLGKGLLQVLQEGECLFALVLLVRHAQEYDPILVDVVEEELVQLPRLHRVWFDAWQQLARDLVKVPHVAGEVAEHDVAPQHALAHQGVVDWHFYQVLLLFCATDSALSRARICNGS